MTINELMKKRNEIWEEAKKFADDHKKDSDYLVGEDLATFNKMEQEMDNYTQEIERLKRVEMKDREMLMATTMPLTERPEKVVNGQVKTGRATDEYKSAVISALRTNFRRVSDVLQEGIDGDGGYLIPEEMDSRIIDVLTEENIMRKLGHTITTSGDHKINVAGTKPAAAWIDEGEALQFEDAKFSQINLDAYKLYVAVKVTEELLYDSAFNLESYIEDAFARALGNAEEDAFLNGNGTGRPTGIFNATNGGEIGVEIPNVNLKADDIINLIYKLKRPYRKNAKFILNDQTISAIRKLKDNNGAYLWQPALMVGEPDRLMGYPLYTSQFCPELEEGKSCIAFGDFSYYNIGDRGTRSFGELKELFAGNGMVGFVAKERVDGKLVLPEAVQLLKVTATK